MTTVRFYLAEFMIVMVPPAVAFWFVAHPLVAIWRRIGPGVTYSLLITMAILLGWVCFLGRGVLVGEDLGTHSAPIILGLVLYFSSIALELQIRKQLPLKTFVGFTELAPDRVDAKLLCEGIYRRVRHPKYASAFLGIFGFALFTNYSGALVMGVLNLPALYLVTVLEERELVDRFGEAYRQYQADVPRLLPRLFS